jgi:hypothetical protein
MLEIVASKSWVAADDGPEMVFFALHTPNRGGS